MPSRTAILIFVRRFIWTFHSSTIGKRPRIQSQAALALPWAIAALGTTAGFMQEPSAVPLICPQKYDGGRHWITVMTTNPIEASQVMAITMYMIHFCHLLTARRRRNTAIEVRMNADIGG